MSHSQEILKISNLTRVFEFGETKINALNGVDLNVKPGEFIVILGPSGAGKTTLLNMIGGIDNPTTGKVIVDAQHLEELSKEDQKIYNRAEKLYNFMTQPFHVTEIYTGKKGEYVKVEDCIEGCAKIISGDFDHLNQEDFYMIGKVPRI